ncbi:MAG TPA: hypothetical protein P5079_03685 [Elusimicrobiota bacterium]|nr:hypothetical protein [Elusimicrobiota bacterium]
MKNVPSKKHLMDHIGDLQKELFDKEGLKLEVEWLEQALRKRTRLLGERAKELGCIVRALKTLRDPRLPVEQKMQELVDFLPRAWQYPQNAGARIQVLKRTFKTANYSETPWRQKCDIVVDGKPQGFAEVAYLCEKPEAEEGPFLREERMLLDVVCGCVGMYLERDSGALLPPDRAGDVPYA